MEDETKRGVLDTIKTLKDDEDKVPIVSVHPFTPEYPHGYFTPESGPVPLTPALEPTIAFETGEGGTVTAEEPVDTEDEDEYAYQITTEGPDDKDEYIEWFNRVIQGYSILPEYDLDSIDPDFDVEHDPEIRTIDS